MDENPLIFDAFGQFFANIDSAAMGLPRIKKLLMIPLAVTTRQWQYPSFNVTLVLASVLHGILSVVL